jgi:hypothetical protein
MQPDNPPAFPLSHSHVELSGTNHECANGLSMRDWFAGQALAGVLQMVATGQHELGVTRPTGAAGIAHSAYELADAMLFARQA